MVKSPYLFIILLAIFLHPALAQGELKASAQKSHFLTYEELKELAQIAEPRQELNAKLENIFHTPLNGQTGFSSKRKLEIDPRTKRKFFRVSHWNLERGYKLKDLDKALNHTSQYISENKDPKEKLRKDLFISEAQIFLESDIYTLNEADFGMQRTDYKNTVEEFAKITKSKYYSFIPEFVEIAPKYINAKDLDKKKLKAMHGNAIVSKFPIISTRIVELPACYDWYNGELKRVTRLEKLKRRMSRVIFDTPIVTELRRGHRNALIARVDLPSSSEDLTVVISHFENRSMPKCRKLQLKHLLTEIKDIDTPLVFSGDLNNSEVSSEPTSVNSVAIRTVSDWQNLARATASYFNPIAYVINPAFLAFNTLRKAHDPTVFGLPLFLRNKTADLFWKLINFEFTDDNMFDFSGNKKLSYNNKGGKLANSNQRVAKGFASTFQLWQDNILTHFRFDWIFVKPLRKPDCQDGEDDFEDIKPECKNFIPAFARNLRELNNSYYKDFPKEIKDDPYRDFALDKLSDHDPITCKILI